MSIGIVSVFLLEHANFIEKLIVVTKSFHFIRRLGAVLLTSYSRLCKKASRSKKDMK